jgi:hypothetical protein
LGSEELEEWGDEMSVEVLPNLIREVVLGHDSLFLKNLTLNLNFFERLKLKLFSFWISPEQTGGATVSRA